MRDGVYILGKVRSLLRSGFDFGELSDLEGKEAPPTKWLFVNCGDEPKWLKPVEGGV